MLYCHFLESYYGDSVVLTNLELLEEKEEEMREEEEEEEVEHEAELDDEDEEEDEDEDEDEEDEEGKKAHDEEAMFDTSQSVGFSQVDFLENLMKAIDTDHPETQEKPDDDEEFQIF